MVVSIQCVNEVVVPAFMSKAREAGYKTRKRPKTGSKGFVVATVTTEDGEVAETRQYMVAAYRDQDGKIDVIYAVVVVKFNAADGGWTVEGVSDIALDAEPLAVAG